MTAKIKNTAKVLALTSSALINYDKKWQPRNIWRFTVNFFFFFAKGQWKSIKHRKKNGEMIPNIKTEQ